MSASYGDEIIWKIGVSKHPEKRFKEHQVANPNLIQICALYECTNSKYAYMIEARIKRELKEFKINGEWFESISMNTDLFIAYCERYYEIAIIYFESIQNIKNENIK